MDGFQANVDMKAFLRGLSGLERDLQEMAFKAAKDLGNAALKKQVARVPVDTRDLRRSRFRKSQSPRKFTIGFNAPHARIMDTGLRSPIRPKRAKKLYVPISPLGKRVGPLPFGDPRRELTILGKDFVFKDEVRLPAPAFKRKKGPNLYFTGTIREMLTSGEFTRLLVKSVRHSLSKRLE